MSTSAAITFRQYFHPPARAAGASAEEIGSWMMALAGLALLSTIANSLYTAVSDDAAREAVVITFVVTASGISLFGIGAAFWGLVAGGVANMVFRIKK